MKNNCLVFLVFFIVFAAGARAQQVMPLYEGKVPGSKENPFFKEYIDSAKSGLHFIYRVSKPTLTVFLPEKSKANGAAVVICPGGAYRLLAIDHEGYELAKRFNENGVTAFVLKYRLPNDSIMENKTIAPLQDAQRAIQIVREGAAKWKLDTNRIGILGSSAGGHLASTAGTHFNMPVIENKRGTSLRPDFMVLLYPVISFGQLAHTGSAKNLLGNDLSDERIKLYSNEMQVTEKTPTTFLLHAGDDKVVKVKNSILFYEALLSKNVPAEMHLYEGGGHGFGLHNPTTKDNWFDSLINWMKASSIIK